MGRHKYDTHRLAFGWAPPAQPTEDPTLSTTMGEGVLDVVKDLAKKVGPKAVSGLARNLGRKVGKEIVGTPLARAAGTEAQPPLGRVATRAHEVGVGPSTQRPTPAVRAAPRPNSKTINDWGGKEVAGDRIREILEANSLEREKTSPSRRKDEGRLGRAQGVTTKANEVISRLLADDDD